MTIDPDALAATFDVCPECGSAFVDADLHACTLAGYDGPMFNTAGRSVRREEVHVRQALDDGDPAGPVWTLRNTSARSAYHRPADPDDPAAGTIDPCNADTHPDLGADPCPAVIWSRATAKRRTKFPCAACFRDRMAANLPDLPADQREVLSV